MLTQGRPQIMSRTETPCPWRVTFKKQLPRVGSRGRTAKCSGAKGRTEVVPVGRQTEGKPFRTAEDRVTGKSKGEGLLEAAKSRMGVRARGS